MDTIRTRLRIRFKISKKLSCFFNFNIMVIGTECNSCSNSTFSFLLKNLFIDILLRIFPSLYVNSILAKVKIKKKRYYLHLFLFNFFLAFLPCPIIVSFLTASSKCQAKCSMFFTSMSVGIVSFH